MSYDSRPPVAQEWIHLADGAGQKVPSFTTRALTIEKLARLYNPEAS
jgi:hypothetical protein